MKKTITSALLLTILLPLPAIAGYDQALKELEEYKPAPWLTSEPAQPPASAAAPSLEPPLPESKAVTPHHAPEKAVDEALASLWSDDSKVLALLGARLDLAELKVLALNRSPRLAAARREAQSARDSIGIAKTLTEALKAYAPFTDSSMPPTGAVMKEGESYPYPSVASLRGQAASLEAATADEKAEGESAAVLTELQTLYWELRTNAITAYINEERLALLATLEQSAGSRYAVGEGGLGEIAMLRAEMEMAREELITLSTERKAKEDALLALLALPGGAPLATPDRAVQPQELHLGLAELKTAARASNRSLAAMRIDLARMETMVAMETAMNYAPPDQGGTVFENRTTAQTGTMAMEPAFSSAPSPSEGVGTPKRALVETERGYINQTKKKIEAARKALEAEGHALDAMVSEEWTGYDAARRERLLYRERVLEYAKLALDANLAAYRSGMGNFPMVLASYRGWLEAFTASEESAGKVGIALARLEQLIGKSPLPTSATGVEQTK